MSTTEIAEVTEKLEDNGRSCNINIAVHMLLGIQTRLNMQNNSMVINKRIKESHKNMHQQIFV